ncbi:MAG: VOC family protein [Novosphingobium sp.]|nr:VOC family protein [Novosphingobium sp.]
MMIPAQRNRDYMQLCWVVTDIEAAIDHWVKTAGAGPFFIFGEVHFTDSNYRGTPMDIAPSRAAMGQFGDTQIELVQPLGDDPGIWRDLVPFGKSGFHHTGLYCTDYEAQRDAYLQAGAELAFEGLMMGAKTCYIDTSPTLGFMTELVTANPIAEQVFGTIRAASEGWDGKDPIRSMG